jgi:hypothetical protein
MRTFAARKRDSGNRSKKHKKANKIIFKYNLQDLKIILPLHPDQKGKCSNKY